MTIITLKATIGRNVVYFQTNEEDSSCTCVISTDENKVFVGQRFIKSDLTLLVSYGEIDKLEEVK